MQDKQGIPKMPGYPEPYLKYLLYFHGERDFFECHEVLEEYWKSVPESPLRPAWHGLIQTAVALYHQRRGNIRGARMMLGNAITNLQEAHLIQLGIDARLFTTLLQERLQALNAQPPAVYADLDIPLADQELSQWCQAQYSANPEMWLQKSDLANLQMIHKHTLRDRSEVIQARRSQLVQRNLADQIKSGEN